jgi:hypothetical protein
LPLIRGIIRAEEIETGFFNSVQGYGTNRIIVNNHTRILAGGKLPFGGPDLSSVEYAAQAATEGGTH